MALARTKEASRSQSHSTLRTGSGPPAVLHGVSGQPNGLADLLATAASDVSSPASAA